MFSPVKTEDSSTSFFNEQFQESYHSSIGAYTEALHKHVKACQVEELATRSDELKILDVCFGLGYNSGVAIERALAINPETKLDIIGLENDTEIIKQIKNLEVPESYQMINNKLAQLGTETSTENFKIKLLMGDARDSIKKILSKQGADIFDAIFFDPFSPKVCPELWTLEFIQDVVKTAKSGAYISTYSSARIVKDNFKAAGCEIHEGPKLNRRSGGVLALKL